MSALARYFVALGKNVAGYDKTPTQLTQELETLGIRENTMIIFSSDNGPVLDDGYQDEAVTQLNGHTPGGILRGGKYSTLEAGTRVPFILSWPALVNQGVSAALVCQMDLLASFSDLLAQKFSEEELLDSENTLDAFLGKSNKGRSVLIEQGSSRGKSLALAIVKDNWKYIPANESDSYGKLGSVESEKENVGQLYDLNLDLGEMNNLAKKYPNKVKELAKLLEQQRQLK